MELGTWQAATHVRCFGRAAERLSCTEFAAFENIEFEVATTLPEGDDDDRKTHACRAMAAALHMATEAAQRMVGPEGRIRPQWSKCPTSGKLQLTFHMYAGSSSSTSESDGSSEEDSQPEVHSSGHVHGQAPSAQQPHSTARDWPPGSSPASQVAAEHERQYPLSLEAAGASVPLSSVQLQRLQSLPQPVTQASLLEALDQPRLGQLAALSHQPPRRPKPQMHNDQSEKCLRRAPHSRAALSSSLVSGR